MQKEASWLVGELPKLIEKGVVDEAAAARLRAYYAALAGAPRLGWGMILLATGGAALIGLGIILIFAHNWENWTPEIRAGLSLLPLLAGQGAAAWALRRGTRAACEAAGLFTAIAAGASIALIAQTYQMGGDLPRFLMTWLLLALPLVYLLDASSVAVACWLLAMGWSMTGSYGFFWNRGFDDVPDALHLVVFLVLFSLPLPHLVRHIRLDRAGARVAWMLRAAIVAMALGLIFARDSRDADALLAVYASMAAAAWLAGQQFFSGVHGLWGNPLRYAGHLGVFVIALIATWDDAVRNVEWPRSSLMVLPYVFGAAALWLAWRDFRAGDRLLAPLLGAFTPVILLLPLIGDRSVAAAVVLGHLYALALAAAMVRAGLKQGRLGLANEGAALVAALVLCRFFDGEVSYVVRGVGFIVTGVGFFVATLWLRRRVREAAAPDDGLRGQA